MAIALSPVESDRFGLRIARGTVDDAADLAQVRSMIDVVDIVIVRADVDRPFLAADLARLDGVRVFTADHLLYWQWSVDGRSFEPLPSGLRVTERADPADVEMLVRASFEGYRNHYAANPLLAPSDILDGYVEWASVLLGSERTTVRLLLDERGPIGFGLLDHSADVPDIRLAAMHHRAQGSGWYRYVLESLMHEAASQGEPGVRISTQSGNVNVMRVWARLGFVPVETFATYHLVAAGLLGTPR